VRVRLGRWWPPGQSGFWRQRPSRVVLVRFIPGDWPSRRYCRGGSVSRKVYHAKRLTSAAVLYKYEAFSTQSLLNLKKQIIYFGSPLHFNDPYDCALTPNIVEPSDEEIVQVRDITQVFAQSLMSFFPRAV
jgi:hypothetical protein